MDRQQAVGWLHRRAGLGLHPHDLKAEGKRDPDDSLDAFLAPPATPRDIWADADLDPKNNGRATAVQAWLGALIASDRPFHDRRTWMLHGWLVSSMDKVRNPEAMVEQIQLFERSGDVDFADLLGDLTVDPAMLVYLDGWTSTAEAPNENYGRELLELFGLGEGNYTEADVQAAAIALTGWKFNRRDRSAKFVPRRHDDTSQTLLGATGVNDVGSVIDAVINDPAHPGFVADRIISEYLGDLTGDTREDVRTDLISTYEATGRRLTAVIERALRLGLAGASTTTVLDPIRWLVICARATGVDLSGLRRSATQSIREMGQVPLFPPSVAGWPRGTEWLTSSSLIARTNVAAVLAAATDPSEPLHIAAADNDVDQLAEHLGLREPFGVGTRRAIGSAVDPVGRLTIALVCPESLTA
ncbi:MAG: DUF1800 family protein [Actinomycetota bacterium]|jgi:uncharacterized protein (DUF1800 family)|uniref:DUF1800 family protein n=1 Tax=uncultured Ilumatobacter sp. TaxID=879968 RepID=UPI00374E6145|nr:DUF1800 family protein [Actinomycetota bacterium]